MFQTTNQLKLQQIIWNWSLCSNRSKFAVANTWQSFWLFLKVFAHTLIAETTKQIIHRLSGNLVILRITQGICQDLWVYGKNLGQWGVDSRSSNFASWGKEPEKKTAVAWQFTIIYPAWIATITQIYAQFANFIRCTGHEKTIPADLLCSHATQRPQQRWNVPSELLKDHGFRCCFSSRIWTW